MKTRGTGTLSMRAKEEAAMTVPNNRFDALAELSGIVAASGVINISSEGLTVSVVTDNADMPSLLSKLSLTAMFAPPEVSFSKHITLTFARGRELLVALGLFRGEPLTRVDGIAEELVRRDSEKKSYIRGAFLGAGFVSAGKNNHMEFSFSGEKLRDDFAALLPPSLGTFGKGIRGGRYTVYFKSKERISDALVYVGATKAALELQQEILRMSVGKLAAAAQNCDVANIDRAISAAERQIEAIDVLDGAVGLDTLGEKLQTTAILRKTYPDANMSEIAEMLGVSKSCVKHRLEKLSAMAAAVKGIKTAAVGGKDTDI